MILNRQKKVAVDIHATREFVKRLRKCLRLGRRGFNVCFVEDFEIARMNATYRGKARPTDVLSFPWHPQSKVENRNWKLATGNLWPGQGSSRVKKGRVSIFEFQV